MLCGCSGARERRTRPVHTLVSSVGLFRNGPPADTLTRVLWQDRAAG